MKFERLFIEKQLVERRKREVEALTQIAKLDKQIHDVVSKRQKLESLDMNQEFLKVQNEAK